MRCSYIHVSQGKGCKRKARETVIFIAINRSHDRGKAMTELRARATRIMKFNI